MGKKILVIDDEEHFTRLVKLNLEKAGDYEVRAENRGALAVAAAKEFKPDLVLLDILMPDVEGGEIAAQLGTDKETKNIPIIFLTAVATRDQVQESGGIIGGRLFIAKPVTTRELIEHIEQNIRR